MVRTVQTLLHSQLACNEMQEEKNKREKAADKSASVLSKQYFCQAQCVV